MNLQLLGHIITITRNPVSSEETAPLVFRREQCKNCETELRVSCFRIGYAGLESRVQALFSIWEFPKIRGTLNWGPNNTNNNKDPGTI